MQIPVKLPEGVSLEDSNRAQQLVNAAMLGYVRITERSRGVPPCSPRAMTWAMLLSAAANTNQDPLGSREAFLEWATSAFDFAASLKAPPTKETTDA